jgi:hypothetical protein
MIFESKPLLPLSINIKYTNSHSVCFCKIIILLVILYECGTWSLTVREDSRLRVFVNRLLRRTFGPETDEVTGVWIRLLNEEVNDLYCSPMLFE